MQIGARIQIFFLSKKGEEFEGKKGGGYVYSR